MLKKVLKISFYAAISTLAVISTVTVYAAFIAPSDTPAASVQDWIGNVLGANNADNAYDSSAIIGNHDGSLLERAEDIRKTVADNTYDSSFATANANGSVLQILKDIKANSRPYVTLCIPTGNVPGCCNTAYGMPSCPTGWTSATGGPYASAGRDANAALYCACCNICQKN